MLFIDVIGSTELAAERPPEEVVELLNGFFAIVVEVVDAHGGWVNKFEGDAALAVFGAPVELDDAAVARAGARRASSPSACRARSRASRRRSGSRPARRSPATSARRRRFEYTVIGDPVNEAARLTELAKERRGRLLASEAIARARRARPSAERWELDGDGGAARARRRPTRVAVPGGISAR